ncbi:activator of stress genes 1 [Parachaetomium inaequale]|uniref:Activator of stress genes 1 n=1 Tax=Parachaetomium inaequale TaxID=2588326 RepID=A0AAN6P9X8_9PEZI|nr:activator of stress genes 1 [Parachaetomium inaequale]
MGAGRCAALARPGTGRINAVIQTVSCSRPQHCKTRIPDDLQAWTDLCRTLVELDRRLQRLEHGAGAKPDTPREATLSVPPSAASSSMPAAAAFGDDSRDRQASQDAVDTCADEPTATANATFMRRGLEAAGPTTASESPMSALESPTFPDLVGFSMQTLEQPLDEIDPHALVLPPRHYADELLRWYWQNFHSIFPFLHWPMFESKYRTVWKQKTPQSHDFDELLFFATLNMVFAVACLRHEAIPLPQRQCHADEFYKRSLRLISIETLDSASIPIVQLLLLRAMHLYFAGRADRCWLMSGAATRVAVGLGLHITPKRQLNQLEREMRRRVWFAGCVSVDQIVSSTFGRSGLIFPGLTQTPIPLAVDEEYLSTTEEGRQPDGLPSRMEMLIYTVKTVEVLEEMRAAARAPRLKLNNQGHEFSMPDPSALLHLNSKIDDLLEQLPLHLRQDADYSKLPLNEDTVKCFRIQSLTVRFRLLIIRVFLLRPSLLAEAQRWTTPTSGSAQTASSMFQERLHYEICSLCLSSVHTMLEEIHRSPATNGGVSAWYALHFTFASATILLVATLSPNLGINLDTEPTKTSWDRAMAILEFHKSHVASAARGLEVLRRYRESITMRASARLGAAGIPPTTQGMMDVTPPPLSYPAQQQQYSQTQPWGAPNAMPTPPLAGTGLMEGLEGYFASDALDEAWLTTQDFGQGNWILDQFRVGQ